MRKSAALRSRQTRCRIPNELSHAPRLSPCTIRVHEIAALALILSHATHPALAFILLHCRLTLPPSYSRPPFPPRLHCAGPHSLRPVLLNRMSESSLLNGVPFSSIPQSVAPPCCLHRPHLRPPPPLPALALHSCSLRLTPYYIPGSRSREPLIRCPCSSLHIRIPLHRSLDPLRLQVSRHLRRLPPCASPTLLALALTPNSDERAFTPDRGPVSSIP
jgi:hypothetical protein